MEEVTNRIRSRGRYHAGSSMRRANWFSERGPIRSHLVKWFGPKDFSATVIENDVRTGGTYHFHMRGPNYDDHWRGTYREVVPPERLVFTWPAGPDSIVTVTFEDVARQDSADSASRRVRNS